MIVDHENMGDSSCRLDLDDKDDYQMARNRAICFLARREHSLLELSNKLQTRNVPPLLLEHVLDELVSEGLQSDQRYAESFTRGRISRGVGPNRIRSELKQRGVSVSLIDQALRTERTDWFKLAQAVRIKRFGCAAPEDFRASAKQKKFLQYRGFTLDIIHRVIPR